MGDSQIEWCNKTWNVTSGCSHVSEGCRNCWAERMHNRFSDRPFTEVRCHPDRLEQPLHWRKPQRIFVNSMSDLFHEDVPDAFIDRVFNVMESCARHAFLVLTKRPQRMLDFVELFLEDGNDEPLARNIWLGVSVEDQKTADERIRLLLQTPAALRWVSYEPALGPVDFTKHLRMKCLTIGTQKITDGVSWLIAGGESGPKARPAHADWFRIARDQCQAAGIPYFFKQWGEWIDFRNLQDIPEDLENPYPKQHRWDDGIISFRVGKKAAGRRLDGRTWDELPK